MHFSQSKNACLLKADPHAILTFECPPPGLKGNTITVGSIGVTDRINVFEIEVLGEFG